jgi:hypothetical protein
MNAVTLDAEYRSCLNHSLLNTDSFGAERLRLTGGRSALLAAVRCSRGLDGVAFSWKMAVYERPHANNHSQGFGMRDLTKLSVIGLVSRIAPCGDLFVLRRGDDFDLLRRLV